MLALIVLLSGCAAGRQAGGPAFGGTPPEAGQSEEGVSITRALERASAGQWQDLHLRTECLGESGLESVTVFGSGTAIWRNRTQFSIPRSRIQSIAALLAESDFAGMREVYGGKGDPQVPPKWAIRVTCLIALTIDGQRKQVTQLRDGHQEERFTELAGKILASLEEPARAGVGADSLQDALEKLSRRELAPETLTVLLHRKPENAGAAEGWLLRVEGGKAITRPYEDSVSTQPVSLALEPAEFASLASALARGQLGDLPSNLYAEHYTDLVVEVLNYKKSVQARQFAGMTAATHGEKQQRFDTVFDGLRALHLRVLEQGE